MMATRTERDFHRTLSARHPEELRATIPRTAATAPNEASSIQEVSETPEHARHNPATQDPGVELPVMVEGVIEHPADVDTFQFQAEAGLDLALEIETPELGPPHFSPLVRVIDAEGEEVCSNIFRRIGGDGDDWIKTLQPKVVCSLENGGRYLLRIRDLTSRRGGPEFRYRVLVRRQEPHVGQVHTTLETGAVNLVQGASHELTVVADQEEGFTGTVAIGAMNLPPGVELLPMTTPEQNVVNPISGPRAEIHRERFMPGRLSTKLALIADSEAPRTSTPVLVHLTARPVVDGRAGRRIDGQKFLLMVIAAGETE